MSAAGSTVIMRNPGAVPFAVYFVVFKRQVPFRFVGYFVGRLSPKIFTPVIYGSFETVSQIFGYSPALLSRVKARAALHREHDSYRAYV